MNKPLVIGREAEAELAEACEWFDAHRPGLGRDLLAAVEQALARIERRPQTGSLAPGVSDASVRQVWIRRFKYHVVFAEVPDRTQVLAIAHERRRPRYWAVRIPR